MWPEEFHPALVPLAGAWAVVTAVGILATAGQGGDVGSAILAPLWIAAGVAVPLHERDRWPVVAAAVLLVVAGLARGWTLLVDFDVVTTVGAARAVANGAVLVGILLVFYDSWLERRSRTASE